MRTVLLNAAMVLSILLVAGTGAQAQTPAMKIGHFDLEGMISIMPGTEKIDSMLQAYYRDSVNSEYQFRLEEFIRNDSTLRADSAKMPAKLYQEKSVSVLRERMMLQNWEEYSQQMMQQKQQELIGPYVQKAMEAFRNVVKEGKYTHVFKSDVFFEVPEADDLLPKVAAKLNIKLPPRQQQQGAPMR